MEKINKKYLFILYFLLAALIYFSTIGAGMVFDFNGWAMTYEKGTYLDVLNCFGYPGLHQVEQFAFFTLYKIFRFNKFAWYLIFVFMHTLSALAGFSFIRLFLKSISFKNYNQIAIVSSFLFLISPMAADVVATKITIHYLMTSIFLLNALNFEVKYLVHKNLKYLLFSLILFILALFSLEIAYVFPLLFSLVWISLLYFRNQFTIKNILNYRIFIPFIILLLFLLLHKVLIGSFIGHYGAEVHTKLDLLELISNIFRYFSTYFFLFDYWPYKYKEFVSLKLLKYGLYLLLLSSAFVGTLYLFLKEKNKKDLIIILLFLFAGIIALLPIANLYLVYMFPVENDRYSYFASIFIYATIVVVISFIKINSLKNFIFVAFICVNFFYLNKNIQSFSKSSKLTWSLIEDFRWFDKEVVILNEPEGINGVKIFTTFIDTTSFSESLWLQTGIDRRKNIKLIYEMNYTELKDSVIVSKISDNSYKVELAQWGNWFWKQNRGATSFENENFKVDVFKKGRNYYILELKDKYKNATLIYAAGDKWVEIK